MTKTEELELGYKKMKKIQKNNTEEKSHWRSCKKKIRYATEHEANMYRKKYEKERGMKLDYYWCGNCKGYHLTKHIESKQVKK